MKIENIELTDYSSEISERVVSLYLCASASLRSQIGEAVLDFLSKAAETMTSMRPEAQDFIDGKPHAFLALDIPDWSKAIREAYDRVIQGQMNFQEWASGRMMGGGSEIPSDQLPCRRVPVDLKLGNVITEQRCIEAYTGVFVGSMKLFQQVLTQPLED